MDEYKEQKELQKRKDNAKAVLIVFTKKEDPLQFFNVVDEHGNMKYDGKININGMSLDDYCSCPSFTNNNFSKTEGYYGDSHGYAFQCKHIICAHDEYKRQSEQVNLFDEFKFDMKPPKGSPTQTLTTAYDTCEQNLVQKDLLL